MRIVVSLLTGLTLAAFAAGGAWWALPQPVALSDDAPLPATAMPMPPLPPRIADDPAYEACLALLPEDPAAALALVRTWQAGADTTRHCQGLALIAAGEVEEGAAMLEALSGAAHLPAHARALLLDQAADAWFQVRAHEQAFRATTQALAVLPDDPEGLVRHARAAALLGREDTVIANLTRVLAEQPDRVDALLARAMAWRRLDRLDQAAGDIDRAARIAPTDPEVLLERGIQRQQRGDLAGARQDWQHVVSLEPDSEAADLAEQNLALLEAGPRRR
jgi:tetratricopeptide (TPR) repeat protein